MSRRYTSDDIAAFAVFVFLAVLPAIESKRCGYRLYSKDPEENRVNTEVGIKECKYGCCWDQAEDVCCTMPPADMVVIGFIIALSIIIVAVSIIALVWYLGVRRKRRYLESLLSSSGAVVPGRLPPTNVTAGVTITMTTPTVETMRDDCNLVMPDCLPSYSPRAIVNNGFDAQDGQYQYQNQQHQLNSHNSTCKKSNNRNSCVKISTNNSSKAGQHVNGICSEDLPTVPVLATTRPRSLSDLQPANEPRDEQKFP